MNTCPKADTDGWAYDCVWFINKNTINRGCYYYFFITKSQWKLFPHSDKTTQAKNFPIFIFASGYLSRSNQLFIKIS